jgi:hypothetical protein
VAIERSVEEILAGLSSQAEGLWGKADAEQQHQALRRAAEEIALVERYEVPPDLEPRFF